MRVKDGRKPSAWPSLFDPVEVELGTSATPSVPRPVRRGRSGPRILDHHTPGQTRCWRAPCRRRTVADPSAAAGRGTSRPSRQPPRQPRGERGDPMTTKNHHHHRWRPAPRCRPSCEDLLSAASAAPHPSPRTGGRRDREGPTLGGPRGAQGSVRRGGRRKGTLRTGHPQGGCGVPDREGRSMRGSPRHPRSRHRPSRHSAPWNGSTVGKTSSCAGRRGPGRRSYWRHSVTKPSRAGLKVAWFTLEDLGGPAAPPSCRRHGVQGHRPCAARRSRCRRRHRPVAGRPGCRRGALPARRRRLREAVGRDQLEPAPVRVRRADAQDAGDRHRRPATCTTPTCARPAETPCDLPRHSPAEG